MDIARQSYLLSPGDHFFVPQLTMYAMSNHSGDTEAEVAFVVIKPSTAAVGAAAGAVPGSAAAAMRSPTLAPREEEEGEGGGGGGGAGGGTAGGPVSPAR